MFGNNYINPSNIDIEYLKRNPNYDKVMKEIEENGGDARDLFFKKVQERGIDPNTILRFIR